MALKYDGLKFTLAQLNQICFKNKNHKNLLADLTSVISGKKVLLCGAGLSFNELDSHIHSYDLVFGMNGLYRQMYQSSAFDFFFIEDRAAYHNYVGNFSNNTKLITVSGMQGNKTRQLNFIHKYGFPLFFKAPKLSKTGNCFFWGGSVAYFALNVLLVCKAKKIGVLGVDLVDSKAYALDDYHSNNDKVMPPNFSLARFCLKHLFDEAKTYFPNIIINDLGIGGIFDGT